MIGARARGATVKVIPREAKHEWRHRTMPHVIVKLWPGKSQQQKTRLAEAITKEVMEILHWKKSSLRIG
jgi:hypothetical protein